MKCPICSETLPARPKNTLFAWPDYDIVGNLEGNKKELAETIQYLKNWIHDHH